MQRGLSEVDIASMDTSIWGRVPALPRTAVLGAEPTPGVSQSSHQPRRGITLGSECLHFFICKVGITTKHVRGLPRGWNK